jgi:hypothetical protein
VYLLSRPDRETRLAGIFERALAPHRSPIHASNTLDLLQDCGLEMTELFTPKET